MIASRPPSDEQNVVRLDPRDPSHRDAAADLVLALFPDSPAGVLGRHFLAHFYFLDLIRDGDMECLLYSWKGKYVAFGLYTRSPFTFIKNGIRRHFIKLCWVAGTSLLMKLSRLLAMYNVVQQDSWRTRHDPGDRIGELLTFGVLEDYRSERDPRSGRKLSAHLFFESMRRMKEEGCDVAQLVVWKENSKAQEFFRKCGGETDASGYCFGNSDVLRFDLARMSF